MANSRAPIRVAGVYAALATPRRLNSIEADTAALLDYLDAVVRGGIDGLVLFGSTGEFVHFEVTERIRVATLAIRRSRVPVVVNASHSTLAGAVDLAEAAVDSGAGGILLMPPYFYQYSDAQILRFYEEFLKFIEGQTPIYLYNLPSLTNPISSGLMERLLTSGEFAGIKDSSGEWEILQSLKALKISQPFQLLVGNESVYMRGRAEGVDGIISGIAAAIPELLVALDRAICNSDLERAQQLNARLEEFTTWLAKFPPALAIKQAAIERGWKVNGFAVPLDEQTSKDLNSFKDWLQGWIPRVLSECGLKRMAKA